MPLSHTHGKGCRPPERGAGVALAGLALALTLALPGPAAAQQSDVRPYAMVRLGYANSEFLLGAPYNGSVDDGSIAYGLAAGAEVGEYLGFEFTMTGYGGFDGRATPCPVGEVCTEVVQTTDNNVRTFTATIVPRLELGRLDFYGRVGYFRAKIETETRFGAHDFTENGLLVGAGALWDFEGRPWTVSVEAARHDDNLYQFTVGVGWQPLIFSE